MRRRLEHRAAHPISLPTNASPRRPSRSKPSSSVPAINRGKHCSASSRPCSRIAVPVKRRRRTATDTRRTDRTILPISCGRNPATVATKNAATVPSFKRHRPPDSQPRSAAGNQPEQREQKHHVEIKPQPAPEPQRAPHAAAPLAQAGVQSHERQNVPGQGQQMPAR